LGQNNLIISKPPALLGDSQSLTIPGIIESLPVCEPPKVQKIRKQTMSSPESLKHTKWECKYHIVWIPKYRKKRLYNELSTEPIRGEERASQVRVSRQEGITFQQWAEKRTNG